MDLKRLRTFVAVTELGSVSAAAQKLRITQPALSRQLQDLQAEFGVRLFDPVGRGLQLSAEGAELLPACQALLGQAEGVLEQARSLRDGESGVLRIGATPHAIANIFPGFLRALAQRFPRVRVEAVEAGSLEQQEMLARGELHAIVTMRMETGPTREGTLLARPHFVAVYDPARFPLRGAAIDVGTLHQMPVLLPRSGYGTRHEFDAACRLAGARPIIAHESTAPETLQALARAGMGIAILPTTAHLDRARLRVRPLRSQGRLMAGELVILWSSRRRRPSYAETFTEILGAQARAVMPLARVGKGVGANLA